MLKNSTPELQNAVLKLFNMVLTSGCFPDVWNQGLISPIHKSGDKSDPNNYRGICVNSNLGKVFCSILNSRIQTFLQEKNVISKCQIGFLPNHRTTDHIYTLHTLINKHVHQKKEGKIFACFIDFKKAFDSIWHEGLFYKILQTGLGGKVYDLIKCMYTENKCAIKIKNQRTEFFSQSRGVRQGCSLSPNLFNIYINELADMLDHSPAPGLTLFDTEVKYLLYADDLVLLSPTKEGLQQNLNILEQYCHNWALAVNFKKTKIMIFQKKPRCQNHKYIFTLNNTIIEHTKNYTYLGLTISASGNFNMAVNALKEKARRALYAIKMKLFKINIPIRIWTKIFDSVILPIALYGSEIWGPLNKLDFKRWDKHPIEALHAEFCRKILQVQRNTPTNACRAELGRFPVVMKIQKRSLKFWRHLNSSLNSSLQFKALQTQELSPETSPLSQLVLDLTNQADTSTASKERIPINKIMNQSKDSYLQHWKNETKSQSRLNCYLTLNREYELADYLYSVRDTKQRQILTKYRLSDHRLAIETGRHKKTWLPKEERVCGHCTTGEVETEMHFLLYCDKYSSPRDTLFTEMTTFIPNFNSLNPEEKLKILMGEGAMAPLAAKYVFACHSLRDTE
uniref:ribonuclease H n=1 Tax=Hucho hucho TaxID=62062 RepID=A0A4W5RDT1_9TELE